MLGDEDYIEQLVGVAKQEIGLRHPLVYDDFNFCDLSAKGGLDKVLEKQKLSQLQSFCKYFEVEISGRGNRKASYYEPLIQLANSCDCCKLIYFFRLFDLNLSVSQLRLRDSST